MKTEIFSFLAIVSLFSVPTASAQLDEAFGDIEEEAPENGQPPGTAPQGTTPQGFMGFQPPTAAEATAESVMTDQQAPSGVVRVIPSWGDLTQSTGERINDTYEMRMKEENAKPLPKRNPFGNRMDDLKGRLKPVPDRKL